ncbi:protein C19orf12 homolog [Ursus arctos]|uniref:protein C19orf12 homolog n=1 Tax=Ursus arctos TaxID=9644 RepID=UPI002546919E|nr:protein C19orf12 homolog [Ursus arctos]
MGTKEKLPRSRQAPGPRRAPASQRKPQQPIAKAKAPKQHTMRLRAVTVVALVLAVAAVVAAVAAVKRTMAAEAAAERMKKVMAAMTVAVVVVAVAVAVAVAPRVSKKPLSVDDVMKLLISIAEEKKMKGGFKDAGSFIGSLLTGITGVIAGRAVGGLLDTWMTTGQFKPIPQIIMELPPDTKQKLYNEATAILRDLEWKDTVELTKQVMGNEFVKQQLLVTLVKFLKG